MLKIPKESLIVVADGRRARVFRNRGSAMQPLLEEETSLVPGRPDGRGASGVSPPERDAQELLEATFARQVADMLYQRAHARDYEHVVLMVDPGTLGQLRTCLHKEVRERVLLEIATDQSKASATDIRTALMSVLSKQP